MPGRANEQNSLVVPDVFGVFPIAGNIHCISKRRPLQTQKAETHPRNSASCINQRRLLRELSGKSTFFIAVPLQLSDWNGGVLHTQWWLILLNFYFYIFVVILVFYIFSSWVTPRKKALMYSDINICVWKVAWNFCEQGTASSKRASRSSFERNLHRRGRIWNSASCVIGISIGLLRQNLPSPCLAYLSGLADGFRFPHFPSLPLPPLLIYAQTQTCSYAVKWGNEVDI